MVPIDLLNKNEPSTFYEGMEILIIYTKEHLLCLVLTHFWKV